MPHQDRTVQDEFIGVESLRHSPYSPISVEAVA